MQSQSGDAIITEMAGLLSRQKLIPFFGAGISRAHLGVAAAELASALAGRLGVPADTALSDLADHFADKFGDPAFIGFLREKLIVSKLDDSKVSAHRLLLSLSPSVLYTTNQDNLFELTAAHYGRPYRRVVTLQDFSDAAPGERLLYKYHGDCDDPKSVVFGQRSYRQRIAARDHPLDIRLQSDLLGKSLLFLGYSFRDENVAKLLDSVKRVFNGGLPPSYLLAFDHDPQMEELRETYGICVINPRQFCPDAATNAEAFERCLKSLCDATVRAQAERGLQEFFSGGQINMRVAIEYEVHAVSAAVGNVPFDDAAKAFRGAFDGTLVPESLESQVAEIFRRLVEQADPSNDNQLGELKAILFNLGLRGALAPTAMAYVMVACNRRHNQGFDWETNLICPAMPDEAMPVAAAMAVALLRDRGEAITDSFRTRANFWFDGAEDVPPTLREYVQLMTKEVWPDGKNPLQRPGFLPRKGFHKIVADLSAQWPKQFRNPES